MSIAENMMQMNGGGDGRSRLNQSNLNKIKSHLRKFNSKKNTHYNTAKAFQQWKELTIEWKEKKKEEANKRQEKERKEFDRKQELKDKERKDGNLDLLMMGEFQGI